MFSDLFVWFQNALDQLGAGPGEWTEDTFLLLIIGAAISISVTLLLCGGSPPDPIPEGHYQGFTMEELSKYDGVGGGPVYISCKGIVYDADPDHYGPEAGYKAFVGKDASLHFGRMTVGESEANAPWDVLSEKEMGILDDWEKKFRSKYPVMGWLIADFCPTPPTTVEGPIPRADLPDWPAPVGPWPPPRTAKPNGAPAGPAAVMASKGGKKPAPKPGIDPSIEALLRQLAPLRESELRALAKRRGVNVNSCKDKRDLLQALVDIELKGSSPGGGAPVKTKRKK
eukprot:Hpha_TRINITY_DN9572_c0_g1::TRINITY_DN9572_c0_g1_i1::g.114910::m.114910